MEHDTPLSQLVSSSVAGLLSLPFVRERGLTLVDEIKGRRGGVLRLRRERQEYALKAAAADAPSTFDAHVQPRWEAIRREASILREISVMCPLYVDSGVHENVEWLLTRWLPGESSIQVRDRIWNTPDLLEKAVGVAELTCSVAEAVARLHESGYLHADLQPAHFLVDSRGKAQLIDFELARRVGESTGYTGGMVHFNSPEVATGMLARQSSIDYDEISEVYSLGAVLYVIFTKQPPVDYGTADHRNIPLETKLGRIVEGRIALSDSVPTELRKVLGWMMEPTRALRCPSATAAVKALQDAVRAMKYAGE